MEDFNENIIKGFSNIDETIEKANSYIRKYIGKNGKWVYVYKDKTLNSRIDKHNKAVDKIHSLYKERKSILRDMEIDPDIESEGGKVADMYGEKLNNIDKKIDEQNKIIKNVDISVKTIHEQSNDIVPVWAYNNHNYEK